MELLRCIENHKRACFFPFAPSSVYNCIRLSLYIPVPCSFSISPSLVHSSWFTTFLCELMGTVCRGTLFLLKNARQWDPYFKLMRSEQWESTCVYDNGQVLEEYIDIKCIALSVVSLYPFFKRSAVLSAFHSHGAAFSFACVKEQCALSLSFYLSLNVSLYLSLTPFCTKTSLYPELDGWLRRNSRIFNCPTLSPLL